MNTLPHLAIACESGGFRCVFVHGVLEAFESAGLCAGAYAAASASVIPAAFAAIGRASDPGIRYWLEVLTERCQPGNGMSEMILSGLAEHGPELEQALFEPEASRLLIATSKVIDSSIAVGVQGPLATRLGREQLLAMARGDDSWAREHLLPVVFDTRASENGARLSAKNFRRVAYASTRMMHAWRIPAEVDGQPFLDGSYTNGCPALDLRVLGYSPVIAIAAGHDGLYTNLYRTRRIEREEAGLEIVAPDCDLAELGVNFTNATQEGLWRAYDHGREKGAAFAEKWVEQKWVEQKNNRDASTPEFTSSPS